MADETKNTGMISDLFIAVGNLFQGMADTVVNGVSTAVQLVESLGKTSISIVEGVAKAAAQILEGVTSAITPKK